MSLNPLARVRPPAFSSDNLLGAGRVNQTSAGGQLGQALGDAAATLQGAAQVVLGTGGNIAGAALDATGIGAAVGVPVIVVSTAITVEGARAATMGTVNLMKRAGDLTGSTREGAIKNNAEQNGGTNKCEKCGQDLQRVGHKSGQKPPDNQLHVHHDPPISEGGGKDSNPVVVCRDCHLNDIYKQ